jgi:DNA-binding transcriptional ArsR family regulator
VRPLFHPSPDDITVEGILHALSDPVRAQIFAQLVQAECSQTCSTFLEVRERTVPKSTLSQHFKILREAGLIHSERRGVELKSTARCKDIEARFPGLLGSILRAHKAQHDRQVKARKRAARP